MRLNSKRSGFGHFYFLNWRPLKAAPRAPGRALDRAVMLRWVQGPLSGDSGHLSPSFPPVSLQMGLCDGRVGVWVLAAPWGASARAALT